MACVANDKVSRTCVTFSNFFRALRNPIRFNVYPPKAASIHFSQENRSTYPIVLQHLKPTKNTQRLKHSKSQNQQNHPPITLQHRLLQALLRMQILIGVILRRIRVRRARFLRRSDMSLEVMPDLLPPFRHLLATAPSTSPTATAIGVGLVSVRVEGAFIARGVGMMCEVAIGGRVLDGLF